MEMGHSKKSAVTATGPAGLAGVVGHALRWALLPAAAVGTIAGVGIATGGVGSTAVMAALADPLSLLAARSPGARPKGALTQTKLRRAAPEERVLANALTRPLDRFAAPGLGGTAPGTVTGPINDTVADAVAGEAPQAPAAVGDVPNPAPAPGGFINTPGGIVVTPGGGGGGGGGTSVTPTPTPTPTTPVVVTPTNPPVSSVPEPETWLTMLLGFGTVGGALRMRRRRERALARVVSNPILG